MLNKISKFINHKPSAISHQLGFTLVELLAVMMVVGVVGGVVGAILISSLVGTNKTNSLDSVRQNGNYALLQMSKAIEFSRNFYGVSIDNSTYKTDCTISAVSPTPTPIPYHYVKIMSNNGQIVTFDCGSSTISSNGASLLDISAVKTTACFFTCTQDVSVLPPTIGIIFTLSSAKANAGNFVENNTSVSFSTSATLRNVNR